MPSTQLKNMVFEASVIMPDSGSGLDTLITHQKGIYFLEVIFHGVSAHGSRPWEGSSATQNYLNSIKNFKVEYPNQTQTISQQQTQV